MSEPSPAVFTPIVRTERLTLTLFSFEKDVQLLADTMNTFESGVDSSPWTSENMTRLMRNLTLGPSNCLGFKPPGPAMYVLHLDSEAGERIGFVSVNERHPDVPPDFGIIIKPEYQNQGYGTEAATALLHYLTQDFGLKNIVGMCMPTNSRSIKIMEKLGFERGGDAVLEPFHVVNVYVLPGMAHLSQETTRLSRWGVEK